MGRDRGRGPDADHPLREPGRLGRAARQASLCSLATAASASASGDTIDVDLGMSAQTSAGAGQAAVTIGAHVQDPSISFCASSGARDAPAAVSPGDQPTTYYFQYGPTTAYGSQTAPVALATGNRFVSVGETVPVSGSLHYRVVAANASGTSSGADQVPLSPSAAAVPFGTCAPPVSLSGATVSPARLVNGCCRRATR